MKLAEGVDLAVVARGTPGYSGAELANVINEAALLAARRGLKGITLAELEEARDKVRWGKERRSLALSEKEKTNTAYHEAGHALLLELPRTHRAAAQGHDHSARPVARLDHVAARGGQIHQPQATNCSTVSSSAWAAASRRKSSLATSPTAPAATSRWRRAIARKMVCEWGMSEKMGMVEYGEHEDYVFLGRDISRARDYSEATAEQIDREVRKLVDDAYRPREGDSDSRNRDKLEVIAKALARIRDARRRADQRSHRTRPIDQSAARTAAALRPETRAGEAAQAGGRRARRDAAAARRIERRAGLEATALAKEQSEHRPGRADGLGKLNPRVATATVSLG